MTFDGPLSLTQYAIVFGASLVAGGLNSVVGGGSFIAFPALVFIGVPPVAANATAAFSLVPGALGSVFAYRKHLSSDRLDRRMVRAFALASILGGTFGAVLLLNTPATFERLIPWLLLFASTLFSFGPLFIPRREAGAPISRLGLIVGTIVQLIIATYGGYFGGGMGIMMMAAWTVIGMTDVHTMSALRVAFGALLNTVAVIAFLYAHAIAFRPGLVMVIGATLSGYVGAVIATRVNGKSVRLFVNAVAWSMTAYFFWRAYAG